MIKEGNIVTKNNYFYESPINENIDIDSEFDFSLSEHIYNLSKTKIKYPLILLSKNTFKAMGTKYNFLDVGARGGLSVLFPYPAVSEKWNKTHKQKFNFYAIEPDEKEYLKLIKSNQYYKVYPNAMSNREGVSDLYLTKSLGKSSLLKPNLQLIQKHSKRIAASVGCGPIDFSIEKTIQIQTTSIDKLFPKN